MDEVKLNTNKEVKLIFKINRMVIFEVNYYTLSTNAHPYFSTSAEEFIRSKRDYRQCGQCQENVLPKGSMAYQFFKKWDVYHLKELNDKIKTELYKDIENLMKHYKYMLIESDIFGTNDTRDFNIHQIKQLSMI